jgi:hypothetical protein
VLLPVTYGLNSLILFLPALSYALDILSSKRIRWPSIKTLITAIVAVIFYFWSNVVGPINSNETDINRPANPFSRDSYEIYLKAGEGFAKFLIPLLAISALGFLSIMVKRLFTASSREKPEHSSVTAVAYLRILVSVMLVIAASVPYSLVGKHPAVFDVEWGSRHGWVFGVAYALLTASLIEALFSKKLTQVIFFSILISAFFTLSVLQFGVKINRQYFETDLKPILRQISDTRPAGLVTIYGSGIPVPQMRDYESNFLWHETTGKSDSYIRISDSLNDSPLSLAGEYGGIDSVYTGPLNPVCITRVQIEAKGYGPQNDGMPYRTQMQRFIISVFQPKSVQIKHIQGTCS